MAFGLLALGVTTAFGATILGGVALTQIRHSAGRLFGSGLALFDALLFPIVVIDLVIWYGIAVVVRHKLMSAINDLFITDLGPQVIAIVLIIIADGLMIRAGLRIAHAPTPARGSRTTPVVESPKGNQP